MSPIAAIEYVLFDMDGLLLDSESIYSEVTSTHSPPLDGFALIGFPDTILKPFGKEMTWDIKAGCMGKPTKDTLIWLNTPRAAERQAAEHLLSFFPDIEISVPTYLAERNRLQDELWPTVGLLPGAEKLIRHLKAHKIPMAVATSSRRRNFELKTGHHTELFALFDGNIVCGDDAQYNMRGKPEPDIFLAAARELLKRDVGPADAPGSPTDAQRAERSKGLVFEDALPGMQAGKRAGMSVVWVPDTQLLSVEYSGEEKADQTLKSLEEFVPEQWGLPPYP
ncbi:HAD-like domain-containing protein [Roridomyces roridus]|uniref:HAD-like domain-containing protein n=1 Tax=Roridomyces roridus TaxID=1738132 RepID=A0AAD7CFX7_9AGAR|nr:HAD-like domain-containing protein [Roridomyces roridus]